MASKQYFPTVGQIEFEGPESKNPMAFRYYDPEKVVKGRKMKDWFRFSMAWWHTLCAEGGDQFGGGTKTFPWNESACPIERAKAKMDAGFEFMRKIGIEYYCFHDVDLVDEAATPEEYEKNLREIVAAETGRNRHQTVVGHGQRLRPRPLHERRIDQPRLRRRGPRHAADQERH